MFSSLQPTKRYYLVMFFIAFVLLQVFTLVVYQQSRVSQDSGEQLLQSYEVLRLGRLSLIDAIDLANDEQYYTLTGISEYAEAFDSTRALLDTKLNELAQFNMDEGSYKKNLLTLRDRIRDLENISASHIAALRGKKIDAYALKTNTQATRMAMVAMRDAYDALAQNESMILHDRRAKADKEHATYIWTLGLGTVLGLGILLLGNIAIIALVTRNSRAKEKIRHDEKLFQTILDGLNDGIFDYNVITNEINYSPTYVIMLGYNPKELGEREDNFYKYIHPDDVQEAVGTMRDLLAGTATKYNNSFRVRHKDGRWLWVLSRGIVIRDTEGKAQRLIGTHTDITAQKQREEELAYFMAENDRQKLELEAAKEKAEAANQAKSDFLATMSHEIRTPMNAVIGLSGLMLKTSLTPKQHQMIATLYANADILLRLVNDLLDISRIEALQVDLEARSFSFNTIFDSLRAMFNGQMAGKGLQFAIDSDGLEDKTFMGDVTRLQQILVNLVNNAFKFTLEGRIAIHATMEPRDGSETQITIKVTDTGVGIPPEKLDRVFEKFVQADQTISRRFGGSGLGLAICKSLVELMGGQIMVESTVGQGSTFTLSVPLHTVSAPQIVTPAATVAPESGSSAGTVLVVEDYAPNVLVATLMLESLGYAADVASNGAEALKKVQSCAKPYDAILMDVQMQGMNGYETTQAVRAIEHERGFRHLIIGLTAHALAGDREKCLAAGMDDYMSKPINPDILAEKFKRPAQAA